MSRTQHLTGPLATFLALLPICAFAQASQMPAVDQIVALVKASPQLRIDKTIFSSAYDAQTHPYVSIRTAPEGTVGGYLLPEGSHEGRLSDATLVLAVPLDSAGSGGVFTQILFSGPNPRAFSYVGYLESGGHLNVTIQAGSIVAKFPYYGDNSPNCCPRKYVVQTYTLQDGRLVKRSERFEAARHE